jgi:hypothetical protein
LDEAEEMGDQRMDMVTTAETATRRPRARTSLERMARVLFMIIRAGKEKEVTERGGGAKEAT